MKDRQHRLEFLSAATDALARGVEPERMLDAIARYSVVELADVAVALLFSRPGVVSRPAIAHGEMDAEPALRDLIGRLTRQPSLSSLVLPVLREIEPTCVPQVPKARWSAQLDDLELRSEFERSLPESLIIVPLTLRSRLVGAIALGRTSSSSPFGQGDLELAVEIARLSALTLENLRLVRDGRRAAERTARLQSLAEGLAGAISEEDTAKVAVRESRAALGADATMLYLAQGTRVRIAAQEGYPEGSLDCFQTFSLVRSYPVSTAVCDLEPVFVSSVRELKARFPELEPFDFRLEALACIPLELDGEAIGCLVLSFAAERTFEPEERALMIAVAQQTAQSMARGRLLESERRARARAEQFAARLQQLQRVTTHLQGEFDEKRVAELAVTEGTIAVGAQAGALWLLDADSSELVLAGSMGFPDEAVRRFARVPLGERLPANEAVRRGQPIWISSRQEYATRYPEAESLSADLLRDQPIAIACVPISLNDQVFGVFMFSLLDGRSFDEDERTFVFILAQHCAQSIQRARVVAEQRRAQAEAESARKRLWSALQMTDPAIVHAGLRELLEELLTRICRELDVDVAVFWKVDALERKLRVLASRGLGTIDAHHAVLVGEGFVGEIAERQRASTTSDPFASDRTSFPPGQYLRAMAGVPLRAGRDVIGVLHVGRHSHTPFAAQDVRLLQLVGDRAAGAIDRAALYERERNARRHLARLTQRLETIIQASPAAIILFDMNLEVKVWNPSAQRILGWSADEVIGKPLPGLHDEEIEGFRSAMDLVGRGEMVGAIETRAVRRDGRVIHIEVWMAPMRDPTGAVECLTVITDIEDRKRAEEALRVEQAKTHAAYELARAADRRKDEFLAMLAHELRNPLAPITTALELMRLNGDPHTERERNIIERQLRHLVRLVDDLLDIARITRGKVQLRKLRIPLGEVVTRAAEMVGPYLASREHAVEIHVSQEDLTVEGDPDRLAQVVANLLTNAGKYTPTGGRIACRAYREGDSARIDVIDNGGGIDPELLPNIFELFVQAEQSPDRAQGGLGIGLTLVRSIVEMHGGRVSASSEGRGRGSCFSVWIPRRPSTHDGPRRSNERAHEAEPRSLRVLIVDDNLDAAELLVEALRRFGHHAESAHDGPSAIRIAQTFRPDVAVLDIGLPGMSGRELARVLRGEHPNMRFLALSGYGQPSDREESRHAGFDVHLVKPVDLGILRRTIERAGEPSFEDPSLHTPHHPPR